MEGGGGVGVQRVIVLPGTVDQRPFLGKFYYMYRDLLSLNSPGESGSRSAHD